MTERREFHIKGRPRLRKAYLYTGAGLPNIYLLNGVTIEHDPDYGDLVTIDNMRGLHRAIGLQIIENLCPMTGAEFRFLRKQIGLTQAALAARMRVSGQTIANYEKEKTQPGAADPHLRLLFLLHILPPDCPSDLVKELMDAIASLCPEQIPEMPRKKIGNGWEAQQLAACA